MIIMASSKQNFRNTSCFVFFPFFTVNMEAEIYKRNCICAIVELLIFAAIAKKKKENKAGKKIKKSFPSDIPLAK